MIRRALAALALALAPAIAQADEGPATPLEALTWKLGPNTRDAFVGWTTAVHLAAIGTTWLLVRGGVDAEVNALARLQNPTFSIAWSAVPMLAGMVVPALVPVGFLATAGGDQGWLRAGGATAQAAVISFAANNLLKAFTGRVSPEALVPADLQERARTFQLGFLEGGLLEGWPSGHAMTNVAAAVALARALPGHPWIPAVAWGWAAWVSLAVVFGIQGEVHWLSDGVAGAAMGWAIGEVVGRAFAPGETGGSIGTPILGVVAGAAILGYQGVF